MHPRRDRHAWVHDLDDEDVAFIKRFLLAGGSLKDLAAAYGISYPTVRLRLDRLIEKIKVLDAARPMSAFERTLRASLADGKLDAATLKTLLAAHETDLEQLLEAAREPANPPVGDDCNVRNAAGDPRAG